MNARAYIRCLDCGQVLADLASDCACPVQRTLMIVSEDDEATFLGQKADEMAPEWEDLVEE